jgi:hypothetical protein
MRLTKLARAGLAAALAAVALVTPRAAAAPPPTPMADPTAQIDPNIVVQIISPRPGERLRGRVEIEGYAADVRSTTGSGLNERDVQLFLNDSNDQSNLFDFALAGRDSPQAVAALGPTFDKAGFWDAWETCSFPEAPYKLIVWVSSLVNAGARNFASVDVYVEGCPQGELLSAPDLATQPGGAAIHVTGPGVRGYSLDPIYADFAAGIDARCPRVEVDCRYGFDFRELPGPGGVRTNSYYRFAVDPVDGTFSLGYSPPGDDPIVSILPVTESAAIRRGTATNRLGIIAQGDWLRLFVNGRQVGEARDDRRPWGQIGWVAASTSTGRAVDVLFDRFVVSTPGPAESLAALFPSEGAPAASSGRVLFRDDFRNPASGWPRESSDPSTRRVGYESGEYSIVKQAGSGGTPFVTRSERFGDFLAEIEARLVAPTVGAFLYVEFRRQDNGDHYALLVDPNDSTFLLRRETGADGTNLIGWTPAPAIAAGTARNRLGIRAQGPEIVLLANGQEIGRARDDALREGALSFGVGNLDDGPAEARFQELVVSSLD